MTPTGWIVRDGLRLAVHDAGGDGTPVIFQHGLCGDARQTTEAFPPDPRFRRLTLDCRGHGASDFDPQPGLAKFSADVAALAEFTGRPVIVGGISMGAAIALRLAVTRPDLLSGLILVRPAWGPGGVLPNLAPNAAVGSLLMRLGAADARDQFLASPTAVRLREMSPDNLASLIGFFDREPLPHTAVLLTALPREPLGVTATEVAALRLPVLICGCAEDAIHPLPLAAQLAGMIRGAAMTELPPKGRDKAAHIAALHAAITTFLTER